MQKAYITRLKDRQCLHRARAKHGYRYALGRKCILHTKVNGATLCGEWASTRRYDLVSSGLSKCRRVRQCKVCKEKAAQALAPAVNQEAVNYWLSSEWVGKKNVDISFGLFKGECDEI